MSISPSLDKANSQSLDTSSNQHDNDRDSVPTETERNGRPEREKIRSPNPDTPLEAYDWADVESRFEQAMKKCGEKEQAIQNEFQRMVELFAIWAKTPSTHVNDRASKRLRTQIMYVDLAEKRLDEKRTQYIKVVQAFEAALSMLKES